MIFAAYAAGVVTGIVIMVAVAVARDICSIHKAVESLKDDE